MVGSPNLDASHHEPTHRYPDEAIACIEQVIHERRDIRHFVPGSLPQGLLERLVSAAHRGPSVGCMQPWRFLRVRAPELREALWRLVEAERLRTAGALPSRGEEFLTLKIEGIREAAEVLVAALMPGRSRRGEGRRGCRAEWAGMAWHDRLAVFLKAMVLTALGRLDQELQELPPLVRELELREREPE